LLGRSVVAGDITFQFHLADDASQLGGLTAELRARSRTERSDIFWAVALNKEIDAEVVELFRSRKVIEIKEREARTTAETGLVNEEARRRDGHWKELRRRFSTACLAGSVFSRGNDRSPGADASDVGKSVTAILSHVTPEIFDRFQEAAARTSDARKGTDALLAAENLRGLPTVFTTLGLVRDDKGSIVFEVDRAPLREVLARIQQQSDYGQAANGRLLADEFAKEPFGWEFEVVRMLALCLLRAGWIETTSKGQTFDSATGSAAVDTFTGNATFRQASFRPRKRIDFPEVVKAAEAFSHTFGSEVPELNQAAIVGRLREEIARAVDRVSDAVVVLRTNRLPGTGALDAGLEPMQAIVRGSEDSALTTFNASHRSIKDAIKRAAELKDALTEPHLADIERARTVLAVAGPFLATETDIGEDLRSASAELDDLLARETFFRELPAIDQHAVALAGEYERRHAAALAERAEAYDRALAELRGTPGWADLATADQASIALPLERGRSTVDGAGVPIHQLRLETQLCPARLQSAVEAVLRAVAGDRVATINLRPYFAGGIETEEQLDAAIAGIREACTRLIGAGKKIVIG
jgi:hypothetical protein